LHVFTSKKAEAGQKRKPFQVPPQAFQVKAKHGLRKGTFSTGPVFS
jgi:hypothetical protein